MKISPDITLVFQIVNFLVLIFLMNVVIYKPIRRILSERKATVAGLSGDIDGFRAGAAERGKALEAGIAKARAEGAVKKDALAAEAAQKEKELLAEINAKAAAELAALKARIEGEAAGARKELEAEIAVLATAIGEKILGRTLQ